MKQDLREDIIIVRTLEENPGATQRELAEALEVSLGKINRMLKECVGRGYLEGTGAGEGRGKTMVYNVSRKGKNLLQRHRVDAALVLASGFGSRFVPLTYEMPKGLLEVFGERMIERQIRQLHEVGIRDITIMVGYLKEKFDYLIDKYQVKLLYNPEFSDKNTLATLYHAREVLKGRNCYILSSDNWMRRNMYHSWEADSWYAASFMEGETREWAMETAKNGVIRSVQVGGRDSWCMYGPVFLTGEFSDAFLPLLEAYYRMPGTENYYWEDVLIRSLRSLPEIYINRQPEGQIYEFENLEELRLFDEKYVHNSGSQAMKLVASVFGAPESCIVDIRCLKAGMTNKSWLFTVAEETAAPVEYRGKSYICRIPGAGTEKLINRKQERTVYGAVEPLGITEELVYFDGESGYKISRYYEGARTADFSREQDRRDCMELLKKLHNSGICLQHRFDLRERLRYYEELCMHSGQGIPFEDYPEIRLQAMEILDWVESMNRPETIAHIDSVKDNFLFTAEGLRMIDWEYSGMADPLLDLGMCAIYSYMDYPEAFALLHSYAELPAEGTEAGGIALQGTAMEDAEALVTAYMGLGGLLWALWSVYKISLGESFGDYTLKMYRYFKNSRQILRNSRKI